MAPHDLSGFFRQGVQALQRRWQVIAGSEYDSETASLRPDLPPEDQPGVLGQMRRCLEARGGEVLARSRAAALGRVYLALSEEGRLRFLRILAEGFDVDLAAAGRALRAAEKAEAAGDAEERRKAIRTLGRTVESPRARILTRFNALPQGVKFLVDLRADLLPEARKDPILASLDDDLRALLAAWFDPGFLELRRISWSTASGALLEKFMAYEAVHPVESWEDLKNRLDLDRRYFAFFHPRMPDEPLIFVEVALVNGMTGNIQTLLDPSMPVLDPQRADTAIFYSISNAQKGLAGVSFGGFLIKRVMDRLAGEFSDLKTFATLSPLPGFLPWLERRLVAEPGILSRGERKRLEPVLGKEAPQEGLAKLLGEAAWVGDDELEDALCPILLRLASRYLVGERRSAGEEAGSGRALDPVAHFHLSNGARVERLNWMADTSPRGLRQSAGLMVNYLYEAKRIEEYHEAYAGEGVASASSSIRNLLK